MASTVLAVPADYGYVLATALFSSLVGQYHATIVGRHRRSAGVEYPNAYALGSDANKHIEKYTFNCAQRAHQNYLENYPAFLVTMLIAGLNNGKVAAGLGLVWLAGRVAYLHGYTRPVRDQGKGRFNGGFQYVGLLGNFGLAVWSVYKVLV